MSDLIKRADAIEMAVDVETPQGTYERAIYVDDLMALPSADAVSREDTVTLNSPISIQADMVLVVRCKDCIHRYYADNRVPHERKWVCERFANEEITDNDFCSWARMKGGNDGSNY